MYPPIVARQRLCEQAPAEGNTIRNNRRIVGLVVFCVVHVVSKK
jgi:hypothetical protein